MPITIYVKAQPSLAPTSGELDAVSDILLSAIIKDGIFRNISLNAKFYFKEDGFTLSFMNICTSDEKLIHYLKRFIAYKLYESGLSDVYEVAQVISNVHGADKFYSLEDFVPKSEREMLFGKYEDDNEDESKEEDSEEDVSKKYICKLTDCFMENPVYLGDSVNVKYDWNQLRHWLFQQDQMKDPMTTLPIDYNDIHFDSVLKNEIDNYVRANLRNKVLANHEKLKAVLAKFRLENTDTHSVKVALRRAAQEGMLPELKYLIKQLKTADDKDTNKRTALHWAVIRGHVDCVKVLLEAGADPKLKDTFNKSSENYASGSSNEALKDLLKEEPSQEEAAHALAATMFEILMQNQLVPPLPRPRRRRP